MPCAIHLPAPAELEPYMGDPVVAAVVRYYQAGGYGIDEMWRRSSPARGARRPCARTARASLLASVCTIANWPWPQMSYASTSCPCAEDLKAHGDGQ